MKVERVGYVEALIIFLLCNSDLLRLQSLFCNLYQAQHYYLGAIEQMKKLLCHFFYFWLFTQNVLLMIVNREEMIQKMLCYNMV